ncbi:MAG: helix-turn-helix transcriptional regulator [Lachnospiraceae bacterium]|nr:helix-turn-helix transcriptional regulator [Lachnospiraceae bacterium]
MGDGQNLKRVLEEKGSNIRKISKITGITASTLYNIVQKDGNLRYDWALRIANVLDIEPEEICENSPFSGALTKEDVYPTVRDPKGFLDNMRVKGYLEGSLTPLLKLYGPTAMPDVDKLLTDFYQLDDEARSEVIQFLNMKKKTHKDQDRVKDVKNIPGW